MHLTGESWVEGAASLEAASDTAGEGWTEGATSPEAALDPPDTIGEGWAEDAASLEAESETPETPVSEGTAEDTEPLLLRDQQTRDTVTWTPATAPSNTGKCVPPVL